MAPEVAPAAWSLQIISKLDAADRRAHQLADGLDPAQINWRPDPGAWSIG